MKKKSQKKPLVNKSSGIDEAEASLIKRISECQTVVSHLDDCPAWKVIKSDLEINRQWVDDNWQDITDDKKLQHARELKLAYNHLVNIEQRYRDDLKNFQETLGKLQNQDTEIIKDYDPE